MCVLYVYVCISRIKTCLYTCMYKSVCESVCVSQHQFSCVNMLTWHNTSRHFEVGHSHSNLPPSISQSLSCAHILRYTPLSQWQDLTLATFFWRRMWLLTHRHPHIAIHTPIVINRNLSLQDRKMKWQIVEQ